MDGDKGSIKLMLYENDQFHREVSLQDSHFSLVTACNRD